MLDDSSYMGSRSERERESRSAKKKRKSKRKFKTEQEWRQHDALLYILYLIFQTFADIQIEFSLFSSLARLYRRYISLKFSLLPPLSLSSPAPLFLFSFSPAYSPPLSSAVPTAQPFLRFIAMARQHNECSTMRERGNDNIPECVNSLKTLHWNVMRFAQGETGWIRRRRIRCVYSVWYARLWMEDHHTFYLCTRFNPVRHLFDELSCSAD